MLPRIATFLSFMLILLAVWATWTFVWQHEGRQSLALAVSAAVFLSFLTPFIIIAIRHQVRRERLKHIDLFAETFQSGPVVAERDVAATTAPGLERTASFEFVRAKYLADLEQGGDFRNRKLDQVPYFPMMLHSDWMLFFCAIPYMLLSGLGMFILFSPAAAYSAPSGILVDWFPGSLLAVGGTTDLSPEDKAALHVNVLTVAGIAFAGAYFYTLRLFLRAVTVFDLSPVTFLRAFGHMVLSVTLAVILYRFVSLSDWWQILDWGNSDTAVAPPAVEKTASAGLEGFWFVLAFGLGFLPESALDHILRFAKMTYKRRYVDIEQHSTVVPLTVLDGIDVYIAFRLEEANIYDVQNLATYNPIMLHIEGPYGIYQTIDWVAQAQLCNVVGADRFLLLKSFNIRTVFDLERAVIDDKADPQIVTEIGRLLVHGTKRDAKMRDDLLDPKPQEAPEQKPVTLQTPAIKHLASVILDDLHVHRLRQLWNEIIGKLEKKNQQVGSTAQLAASVPTAALTEPKDLEKP